MIAGLGIDIIEVERVATRIKKENGFRELVFSENEIEYCERQGNRFECYAARYAAKEAFFKALGTGWLSGTAFNEVEVIKDDQGKPGIGLLGNTRQVIAAFAFTNLLLSLSHVKETAAATVIIEK